MKRLALVLCAASALVACGAAPRRASGAPQPPPPVATPALDAREGDATFTNYTFRDGSVMPEVRIHYATAGNPQRNASGAITNAVLLLHWTGASGAVLRGKPFADALFAPGKPLDPAKYYLVFIDAVGHGRSSKPSDGLHARFSAYGYRDIVDLQHRVVKDVLGLAHLHAIVGLSMGGMNAWTWSEAYPDEVDGIMPIVSLPTRIAGRNLLWRRYVTRQIRNDPAWNGGDYTSPPRGWVEAFPVFRMMLDGVPHLQSTLPDANAADSFIRDAMTQAAQTDANDILYSLESSRDYDPEASLETIRAKVFALNFSDDEFNPTSLGTLERLMPRVRGARFVIQDGNDRSFGHFTQAHPELWASQVGAFLSFLESGS